MTAPGDGLALRSGVPGGEGATVAKANFDADLSSGLRISVPEPIPGARLDLLPANRTCPPAREAPLLMPLSGEGSSDRSRDADVGGVGFRVGMVLPEFRLTSGEGLRAGARGEGLCVM